MALAVLEEAGADRLTRLRAMAVYSRMVRATGPRLRRRQPRSAASGFKAAAAFAGFVHGFLVGTQERFRLWLVLMPLGVRIVLHGRAARGGRRLREPARARPWAAFAEGLSDFEALDASHLAAFEALAASLSAIDRGGRLELWERIAGDSR